MKKINLIWLITGLLLISRVMIAAEAGNTEEWEPVSAGPITTWAAPVCGKGVLYIQPLLYFSQSKGYFFGQGDYFDWPDGIKYRQKQQLLFIQYGLSDRWEAAVQMAYQQNYAREQNDDDEELDEATSSGLADTYLFARYCAIEETESIPHVTWLLQLKLPTGKYQHGEADKYGTDIMGTGSYDPGIGVVLTKKIKPVMVHFDFLYSRPSKVTVDDISTRYANYVNYDFGVEYFLPKGFNLMLEFNGFKQGETEWNGVFAIDTNSEYMLMAPGIGWSNEKIQTLIAWQRTLSGTNIDKNNTLVLTAVFGF